MFFFFFRNIQKVHFKENTKKISYNFCLDKKVDQIKIKTKTLNRTQTYRSDLKLKSMSENKSKAKYFKNNI